MQNIAIAKGGDEHQERCLFFFRINRFELLNKGHVPWAGFLGWSMAHPDHPLATPLYVWVLICAKVQHSILAPLLKKLAPPNKL